jgi:hypothetical protein
MAPNEAANIMAKTDAAWRASHYSPSSQHPTRNRKESRDEIMEIIVFWHSSGSNLHSSQTKDPPSI